MVAGNPEKHLRDSLKKKQPELLIRRLTPRLMDDLGLVFRGSWGKGCWCMFPRLTDKQTTALPGAGIFTSSSIKHLPL